MSRWMRTHGLLHVREAARLLERDVITIYRMIWAGRLRGVKHNGRWLIWGSDIRRQIAGARKSNAGRR
jgi:excisionase family DNA binding protein